MKTVVMVMQEENWEDDGGAHDPFVTQLSDEDYAAINKALEEGNFDPTGAHEDLNAAIEKGTLVPTYPLQIDDVMNVWYSF